MALTSSSGSSGQYRPLAEINVTPLVDVMLVLLIIFMITAPMMAAGMKVNLPQAKAAQPLDPKETIVITVGKDGTIRLGGEDIARNLLIDVVKARLGGDESRAVHLRGDRETAFGDIVTVLDDLARNGVVRIAIVTERSKLPMLDKGVKP